MDSVGEKLKNARIGRNCSMEQAARDTHISRRFLEALEEEDFPALPGESYVVGFLRSYSEYLGLDSAEVVNLYRNIQLQEQPAPLEELIVRSGMPVALKVLLGVLLAGAAGLGILLFVQSGKDGTPVARVVEVAPDSTDAGPVELGTDPLKGSFATGQVFRMAIKGRVFEFRFNISAEGTPEVNLEDGTVAVTVGQESQLDLDGDGHMDIVFTVGNMDAGRHPGRMAITLARFVGGEGSAPVVANTGSTGAGAGRGATTVAAREKRPLAFPEYPAEGRIDARVTFTSVQPFRYQADGGKITERMSVAGEVLSLAASDALRLWFSDSGGALIMAGARTVKAGTEGEVTAWELSRKDPAAPGVLSLLPMY